jgi:RNA polymerase sigma-70 factor (ECF subfamily)
MAGGTHVVDRMQARAQAAVIEPEVPDPGPDPIAAMIAAGQHREALAACARTHGRALGRLCMAMLGVQQDADEAVQETLIAAHRSMAGYRSEGSVRAWLCGIARHVCARQLETRRRAARPLEVVPPDAEDPAGAFAARRRADAVRGALDRLRPTEREALVMRYVGELSHREVATACAIDEATARKRVSRALDRLRSVLAPEEIE